MTRKEKLKRTILIKAYDRTDRILGKGLLLASAPVLVPADTVATMILEKKTPIKAFKKVSKEVKKRLNVGEKNHFLGVNLWKGDKQNAKRFKNHYDGEINIIYDKSLEII